MAIRIGNVAGHHFGKTAEDGLTISRHCTDGTRKGYFLTRKWLHDRSEFEKNATKGWAYEHWFEWIDQP